MIKMIFLLLLLLCGLAGLAQEEEQQSAIQELQMEQQLMRDENVNEDDGQWQDAGYFRRKPLRLNAATAVDLQSLQLLSPWQIKSLLLYKKVFGKLLSIYELQAVPGWDEATIRQIQPYISITATEATDLPFLYRFSKGESSVLLRSGKVLDRAGPSSFVRYRYKLDKQLQWGFTAERDAGEPFFKGKQRNGFDFYSAHLFARRVGGVQVLALGDFQVNMGQGLIQWQSMNYAQGAVLSLKKQSGVLQPYSSAGEFNFHRGAGITIGSGALQATAFVSYRKLSAHLQQDSAGIYFTNFVNSGYHRTPSEQEARQTVKLLTSGASLQLRKHVWQLGLNAVQYQLDIPMQKPEALYRLFAIEGQRWLNASIDYSVTIRNLHFFGEAAMDKRNAFAFTQGLLCSIDPKIQVGLAYRNFSKQFQSLFSSAVSQGTAPSNEEAISIRMEWQPSRRWKMQTLAELFRFPWLRYRVDAPANGYEHLISVIHQPSRKISLQCRYQISSKPINQSDTVALKSPAWQQRKQWRLQWSWEMNTKFTFTQRTDYLIAGHKAAMQETGVSWWFDVNYKFSGEWMFNTRVHFYETEGYQSRIYSYERDLLYSYAMPAFSGSAIKAYVLARYKLKHKQQGVKKNWSAEYWVKYAFTVRPSKDFILENEDIAGNQDLKFQFLIYFR